MDSEKVFEILGIEATKDENAIKKAYRAKLVHVNPEDNPEGFKNLREAYEEALRLSKIEDNEQQADTPIDKWIKMVEDVYKKRSKRVDINCWKSLFQEEVCTDFDTFLEARDRFLIFVMDHYRLTPEVWELIEETFQLVESSEELKEKFPVNFVDFLVLEPHDKGWFDLTLFEGDDEGNIDSFVNDYLELKSMNDSRNYEGLDELLNRIEDTGLYHPYIEVERLRYYIINKDYKEVKNICDRLLEINEPDLYIQFFIAQSQLELDQLDDFYSTCMHILDENPDHFGAKILLAQYYLKKEEFDEAKERYLELIEIDCYNQMLIEGLQKANEGLMVEIRKQLEEEPDNKSLIMELGWCLYQNKLYEECKDLVESVEIDDVIYYDYNNLMSRTYLELNDYEKGFECCKKWLDEILRTENDGSKEATKRYKRLGLAYYLLGRCYHHFGKSKEDKKPDYDKSIEYIDLAVKSDENVNNTILYLSAKMQMLSEIGEDKLCIDVCDEIIRLDKGYYPAYVFRQEAYFNLRMPREVIDDYINAVEIYAGGSQPYIYAVKVYQIYNQFNDAQDVINRAKEAGVESNTLKYLELKNKRLMADTDEERKKVAIELEELSRKVQQEPGDLEDINELLYEQALGYYFIDENDVALKIVERILSTTIDTDSLMLKGDILYQQGNYWESIKAYDELLNIEREYAHAYFRKGLSFKALDNQDAALSCFLECQKYNPNHRYVNNELMKIYKARYRTYHHQDDYIKSLEHAKEQVRISPDKSYYVIDLGIIHLDGYNLNEAIKVFEEATAIDETNGYPYNNIGFAYIIMGEFEKAIEYYDKAIELIGDSDMLPYLNKAEVYRAIGQFDKAIELYKLIASKRNNPNAENENLLETYKQMGNWKEALKIVSKIYENDREGELDYLLDSGELYALVGEQKKSLSLYKKAIKKNKAIAKAYLRMGEFYLYVAKKPKKALEYFIKAHSIAKSFDSENIEKALKGTINALYELGSQSEGKKYLEQLYKFYNNKYGCVENYLNYPRFKKARLYSIAISNFYVGDYDKVRQYMEIMKQTPKCSYCTYRTCFEYLVLEAKMLELENDYEGALKKYQETLEIAPDNLDYIHMMELVKEKLK